MTRLQRHYENRRTTAGRLKKVFDKKSEDKMELESDAKFWEKMYNDSDRIFWKQHNKLCDALGMNDHEAYTTSNNNVIEKVKELREEVYKLRANLIEKEECPACGGILKNTEISLSDNSVTFIYICCTCDKKWLYYGKELKLEE